MYKISLGGFHFRSHLSLLYFRICARIVCKIEGSKYKLLGLETGRLKAGKKQAIIHYCQFFKVPCIYIVHGATPCL
jgi:hypothetical protein